MNRYLLLSICLLLVGCKEEQVMYKTKKSAEELRQMQAELDLADQQEAARSKLRSTPEAPEPPQRPLLDASVAVREDTAAGIAFSVPTTWERREGKSALRLAEYRVPGSGGAGDGEMVLFSFGQGQGGGVQANVARWLKQFKQPDGSDTFGKAETFTSHVGRLHVTEVHVSGTFAPPAMGEGEPTPEPKPDHALSGIIVEGGDGGTLFLKLTGPQATMDAAGPAFASLVSSFHVVGEAAPVPGAAVDAPPEGMANVAGLLFKVPAGWKKVKPKSEMRAGEYVVSDGSGSAELALFAFGRGQGGDTASNIARWVAQFTQPDGKASADAADVAETEVNGLKVTQVRVRGTYAAGSAMSGGTEAEPLKDAALWGLIVEGTPRGVVFFKMTGSRATVEGQQAAQDELVLSLVPAR